MISLKSSDQRFYQDLFEQMFKGRAEIFAKRLKWPVTVSDGLEIDYYDRELEPTYILDVDDDGRVRGSLRILPTTAETMIAREFLDFFEEPVAIADPLMWECTKFCVHDGDSGTSVRLLLALHDHCAARGIARIVGLYELQMERVYARLGWQPARIATARPGVGNLAVGIWTVEEEPRRQMLRKLERRGGA